MARKEEEADNNQRSVSGSSEKYRMKASESSPFHPNLQSADMLTDHSACRQPMADVGNTEVKFNLQSYCTNVTDLFMHAYDEF